MAKRFEIETPSRVKEYLTDTLRLSSKFITFLKKREDGILLNGVRVTVRAAMKAGDVLSLALDEEKENPSILPTRLPLSVLYEDEDILAVNKPYGMPTHPSQGHFSDTLANAVAYYYKEKGRPFVFRAVNRLDGDTSGVVLIAKNRRAASLLSDALREGRVEKTYLALLSAIPEEANGRITSYIRRKSGSVLLRESLDEKTDGADYAETDYRVIGTGNGVALAEVRPKTGRTHQIRVHMRSIGCPLLGDYLYGKEEGFHRQALHAKSLSFPHPTSGEYVTVTAELPDDMRDHIANYVNHYLQK